MSGTDPKGKWFGKKADPTQPFAPDGAEANHTLPDNLPKIPGITLQYEIARGGMGVVYSGRQDFLDRRVAVKFLSVDLGGASFAQRFQREAKILAGINHPNIVGCFMADTTPEGQSYLVMEFIDGPSLKAWIQDNGAIPPMAALRLIRATANALHHAHQADIIHRDVKPENVLLESATSSALDINFPFLPKVVDLGLARMTHDEVGAGLTSPGSVMGTPATMSPEQFDDPDSVDFRSDIYGLGCCLYEMLVGQPAFRGQKLTEIVVRKREPSAPNPCDENPNLPAAVGAFTQRLLACDRDDRPASYKELDREADELMQALMVSRASQAKDAFGDSGMQQTIVSKPGGGSPAAPTQPGPAAQKPASMAPGMLNTGELDFLSEGGPLADEPATPAFRDQDSTVPPGVAPGTSATQPAAGDGSGSNKGLMIGVGVAAVVAAAAGVMFGMGGGGGEDNEPGGGGNQQAMVVGAGGANAIPKIAAIQMRIDGKDVTDAVVDLGQGFELVASVSDADGDELDYKWKWPTDVMHPVSDASSETVQFELDDGLPGVEHTVTLEVNDDKALPVTRSFQVKVGACEEAMPLIGFKSTGWVTGKGRWIETDDPAVVANRGVSGRVLGSGPADISIEVGDEPYWEWNGTLEPTEMGDGEAAAMVALSFADKGLAVRCERVNEEADWSVAVLERVPGQVTWRPLSPPIKVGWNQPKNSDGASRGAFSIRRLRERLLVEIGEFAQPPPESGQPLRPPTIVLQPEHSMELTPEDCAALSEGGKIELVVTKGRCVFRATRR